MSEFIRKFLLGVALFVFMTLLFWFSGIPWRYLIDLPTAVFLIVGVSLLYGIRFKKRMDIVKKRELLLTSLWRVTFVTLFIGIMGVLTHVKDLESAFSGLAVALITLPYAGCLWLLIELYFNYRASREVDVYSELNPEEGIVTLDPIEMERVTLKQKYQLTPRETEIVGELLKGKTNREIAQTLFISEMTVKKHMANIFSKVGVSNRQALIVLIHQKN